MTLGEAKKCRECINCLLYTGQLKCHANQLADGEYPSFCFELRENPEKCGESARWFVKHNEAR